jgi:hypothetical protein
MVNYYFPIRASLAATALLFTMLARNFHHVRRGSKDIYAMPWPIRLCFVATSFLCIAFAIDFTVGPDAAKSMDWPAYMGIGFAAIPFFLLSWYFVLYRVATDGKAIYYAAFFTTVIPFDSITRIVVKSARRGPDYAYVYSKGHLPVYISGYLPDYSDLMGSIWDSSPSTVRES